VGRSGRGIKFIACIIIRNVYMPQTKSVTRYVTDPSFRQGGHSMTYKTASVLNTTKLVMSLRWG
jgi:hypothetical protein